MKRFLPGLLALAIVWSGCETEPPPELFSYSEPSEHPKAELYPPIGYVADGSEWIARPERTPENRFAPADEPMGPMGGYTGEVASWSSADGLILTERVMDAVILDPFVIVADIQQSSVFSIHSETGVTEIIGPMGEGPLEFEYPADIEVLDENTILVLSWRREVNTISRVDGNWVEESSFTTDFSPQGMCGLGDRLAVYGRPELEGGGGIVRVMTLEGEVTGSFGDGYNFDIPILMETMTGMAGIACFPELDQVVIAYRFIPVIMSYHSDGTLIWVRYLDDFTPQRKEDIVGSGGDHGVGHPNPTAGMDLIEDLFRIEGTNGFAVVVSEATEEDPPPDHNPLFEVITIDASSGELITMGVGPRVFSASREGLVAFTVYPEPAIHRAGIPDLFADLP